MAEVPKIIYDRLRAARQDRALLGVVLPEQAHPDADLLTAFAEQALSAAERDGVLDHLALCGGCREVIAVALPVVDIAAAPVAAETEAGRESRVPAKAERSWLELAWPRLGWPNLRWAALAAGVVVAASVLLMHPGKLNQAMPPSATRQVASPARASDAQIATTSSVPSSPIATSPMPQPAISARTDETRPKPEMQLSKKLKAGKPVTPHQAQSEVVSADNKKNSVPAGKLPASPSTGASASEVSARQGSTETVEVAAAVAEVTSEPSPETSLMARNEAPPIVRAKPAQGAEATEVEATEVNDRQKNVRQTTETAVGPGLAASPDTNTMSAARLAPSASSALVERNVIWTILAGALRQSLDGGQSWQDALHANHPLLCYAPHGGDIWAGGRVGTLFHSTNNGITWVQVQASVKDQKLSSDITHIDLRGDVPSQLQIVLSTSNNEIWSSADGGKSWEKK